MKTEIMMIAAEASSAHYALKLIKYWQAEGKNYSFFGVGSNEMEQLGFERFGKSEEMAVVGIAEVVAHYSDLKDIFNKLVDEALKRKPKVVILMDYPDFNLMLAKKLNEAGIKCFYYISPQVWAWRKSRINKIKQYCEKTFLLFPFEVDFYKEKNVPYLFVGHPLLEDIEPSLLDTNKIKLNKEKYGIKANEFTLALMPGSRKSEIEQHFEIQLAVAKRLIKKYDNLRLLVLTAPTVKKELLLEKLENFKSPYIILADEPAKMISLADYVLVASGTATLMVGLLQKPMVIMYRMKWLTGIIGKILVRGIKYFGLVNLILNKEAVPERMQGEANEEELFNLLDRMISDQDYKNRVVDDLKTLPNYLGEKGATARVAMAVESYL